MSISDNQTDVQSLRSGDEGDHWLLRQDHLAVPTVLAWHLWTAEDPGEVQFQNNPRTKCGEQGGSLDNDVHLGASV